MDQSSSTEFTPSTDLGSSASARAARDAAMASFLASGRMLLGWVQAATEANLALSRRLASHAEEALEAVAAGGSAQEAAGRMLALAKAMGSTGIAGAQDYGALSVRCATEAMELARTSLAAPLDLALQRDGR